MRKKCPGKRIPLLSVIFWCILIMACRQELTVQKTIKFNGLKVNDIEMTEKVVEGGPISVDFAKNEVYIKSDMRKKRKFSISIMNFERFEVLRTVELPAGDFQSPTEYFSPVYVEFIDNRYYIVDQFEKIVVYDEQFNHLYSSMFKQLRFFIDIFPYNRELFLLVGTQRFNNKKTNIRIKLYRLEANKKPSEYMDISPKMEIHTLYPENIDKELPSGYFWPAAHGFEKDGRLYYSLGDRKEIFVYDLKTGTKDAYSLSYLEGKKYSDREAVKLGFYNTDGWEERFFKANGKRVIYKAYPEVMYHFGIYNAGKDKIGVAADVNLEDMTFRLDIIDANSWEYQWSIRLPICFTFKFTIKSLYTGLAKGFIDVDKGVYIHLDKEGEDFRNVTRIDKFNIITHKKNGGK